MRNEMMMMRTTYGGAPNVYKKRVRIVIFLLFFFCMYSFFNSSQVGLAPVSRGATTTHYGPPFATDPRCPRFLVQRHHPDAGIGHLFGGVLFSAKLAKDTGAALVLDDGFWTAVHDKHGGFPYFRRLFGLYKFLAVSELDALSIALTPKDCSSRAEYYALFASPSAPCNIQVTLDSSFGNFCENDWCFQNWPGVYNEMQPLFQSIYRPDAVLPLVVDHFKDRPSSPTHRNIVWHIRASDISLHANDAPFFSTLYTSIEHTTAALGIKATHWFFYGDKGLSNKVGDSPPPGFEFLKSLIPGAVFVSSSRPELDLYHFSQADVLVGTGSSFPHTAAIVSRSNLIYLEHPPKEVKSIDNKIWQTYHLQSSLTVDYNGTLLNKDKLRQRLLQQYTREGGRRLCR